MKRLVALYGRTPMGEGTPLTESLTSFVGRLATARHLTSTAVFDALSVPNCPRAWYVKRRGFRDSWHRVRPSMMAWGGTRKPWRVP